MGDALLTCAYEALRPRVRGMFWFGAGQNMIPFSFPACGRGNSGGVPLPGESVGRKGGLGPFGSFYGLPPGPAGCALPGESVDGRGLDTLQEAPTPQSLPWGVEQSGDCSVRSRRSHHKP